MSATVRQKGIRFARSWASRRVDRQICRIIPGPSIEHRLYDAPSLLDHVGAHE